MNEFKVTVIGKDRGGKFYQVTKKGYILLHG